MTQAQIQQGNDAIDALHKIASLLNAALHLNTKDDTEHSAMAELIGIAEDVANRVIEDSSKARSSN
ncbi:TPA: hypothetical protein I8235_000966 [Kluyvera intermedia]|nr:hypothetical protein [Kluyvera intermedia]